MSEDKNIPSERIRRALEMDIIEGKYIDRLPSLIQMASLYGCSDRTGAKILNAMVADGICRAEQYKGYYLVAGAKNKLIEKYRILSINKMEKLIREAKELGMQKDMVISAVGSCVEQIFS